MFAASKQKAIRRDLMLIFSVESEKATFAAGTKRGVIFAPPSPSPAAGFYSVQVTLQCRLFPAGFVEF